MNNTLRCPASYVTKSHTFLRNSYRSTAPRSIQPKLPIYSPNSQNSHYPEYWNGCMAIQRHTGPPINVFVQLARHTNTFWLYWTSSKKHIFVSAGPPVAISSVGAEADQPVRHHDVILCCVFSNGSNLLRALRTSTRCTPRASRTISILPWSSIFRKTLLRKTQLRFQIGPHHTWVIILTSSETLTSIEVAVSEEAEMITQV